MPSLTKVEAKGWRGRLFLAGVTLALTIGGATMLYPFLLMVSGAMRSDMDASDMSLVPKYLIQDDDLVRKFTETKYNYDPIMMNRYHQGQAYNVKSLVIPQNVNATAVSDLRAFFSDYDLPDYWQVLGGTELKLGISCINHERLVKKLRQDYNDDLVTFNAELGAPLRSWWLISVRLPHWDEARTKMTRTGLLEAYFELMHESDPSERALVNLTSLFLERLIYPVYGMNTFEKFSTQEGVDTDSYATFTLPSRVFPLEQASLRNYWLQFVLEDHVNLSFVRSDATDADYQVFLQEHYKTMENLLRYWHDEPYTNFSEIRLISNFCKFVVF